ncbi:hypothetical protein M3Y98_01092100 [Aphelenchoides besseyi]|nr:hypothetical protein M3Y98_01092100 [Aphelenchoides besseyi]KAI6209404.1 hypothetical protein M3Y96_00218100 [Aphelenchoides besseyi]
MNPVVFVLLISALAFSSAAELNADPENINQLDFYRHRRFGVPLFSNNKRAEFEDDPRLFSTAFGKRSNLAYALDDPRMFSTAFGKRSSDSRVYAKRSYSAAFDDPRLFSTAYGRR